MRAVPVFSQPWPLQLFNWQVLIAAFAAIAGLSVAVLPLSAAGMMIGLPVFFLFTVITPLSGLVFLLVWAPLRTLIATEAGFSLPLDIGQLLVMVFVAAWGLERVVTTRRLFVLPWSPVWWSLAGFIVAGAMTVFGAWSTGAWLTEWLKWILVLVLAVLVLDLASNQRWEWLLLGVVAAGTANAIVGLYIFTGGSGADHLLVAGRFFRAFGTFGQPNPFGGFMGLLAPVAIATAWGYMLLAWNRWLNENRLDRTSTLLAVLYALCGGLMAAALIASWSRGAWLSFGGAVILMVIALPRRWWQSALMGIVLLFLAAVIWSSGFIPAPIADRVNSATEELFTVNDVRAVDITTGNFAIVERLAHWQAALSMAETHPWLGVGLGNYEIAYDDFRLINWPEALGHAHNYYLNILAEGGIIGFTAYLALWITILGLTLSTRQHPDPLARSVAVGLLGTWSYLLIHSLTDNLYVNNMFLHLGALLGLLAIIERERRHSHRLEYAR